MTKTNRSSSTSSETNEFRLCREAEQTKLLYETLNHSSLANSHRLYQGEYREVSRLEPRRSNPLDRCQLPEDQWQIPSSKVIPSDYSESEELPVKQHDTDTFNDGEPTEHYLQVDPRCYVRQNSTPYRRSETPRLEKGHSLNVDTRPTSGGSSTLSPYRQSSFDVALAYHPSNQHVSPAVSSQQEIYFTPRGSSLSVLGNPSTNTPPGSQHLSPLARNNSPLDKKDLSVEIDPSGQVSTTRSLVVQREHELSRSLEHSSPSTNATVDKQSRSSDAVNLLRPVATHRGDVAVNRRTKSYEYAEEHQSFAPPPIVIRIPDMKELVQAAQLSHFQKKESNGYRHRRTPLAHQIIINNHHHHPTTDDHWRSYPCRELEEQQQQQIDRASPEDLSPDLLTSTSIDSAGAMAIQQEKNEGAGLEDDATYLYRRKSSSNLLLLPPPEVRRQALRRTFEKRRSRINQSNARREQELAGLDDDYNHSDPSSTIQSNDFSSLLNNFNSKSANSSFDRSLETDFDMQSDTSSRGPNDHFTSIESSGNEYALADSVNQHLLTNYPKQGGEQQQSPHQDDSGYKSLESQNSQNRTFSLDWMSADGGESVIYLGESRLHPQQRSVDVKDLEEDLAELNHNRIQSNSNHLSASRKRREFRKDKHHAASNVTLPHFLTADDHQSSLPTVHHIDELDTKHVPSSSSLSLQVRYHDYRRSKSDETEILHSPMEELTPDSNQPTMDDRTHSAPIPNLNQAHARPVFQRSPSSATPSVAGLSPQILAFRSKRGSISFDNQTTPPILPATSPAKTLPARPDAPSNVMKPRFKFSMVRDSTTGSLNSRGAITYSTPIKTDLTIDEKTNRIINEFLMQDKNHDSSFPEPEKHPGNHRIRPEVQIPINSVNHLSNQQPRTKFTEQRQHSVIQSRTRPPVPIRYPSLHLEDRFAQTESTVSPRLIQQSVPVLRRDTGMSVDSPSIIVTGYDSGS